MSAYLEIKELFDSAKEMIEASIKLSYAYYDECDKNVINFIILVSKTLLKCK